MKSEEQRLQVAALKYKGVGAPRLIAKGEGALAARIRDLAALHDIPLVEDEILTSLLSKVQLGSEIPENLYIAVAEVLAYIYTIGDSVDTQV